MNEDIAKRAVACKGVWFWPVGMLAIAGTERQRIVHKDHTIGENWLPDLDDPLTALGLQAVVQHYFAEPVWLHLYAQSSGKWLPRVGEKYLTTTAFATQAEAWVHVLEALCEEKRQA